MTIAALALEREYFQMQFLLCVSSSSWQVLRHVACYGLAFPFHLFIGVRLTFVLLTDDVKFVLEFFLYSFCSCSSHFL